MDERLKKQLAFALEIDKEKNIFRQTHLSGHGRNENDAEHAWHMALMSWLLREYANEDVDIARVMLMCLIHDIVEIDAGDTYAYDEEGLATQKAREEAAKERIFSLLPGDQKKELTALFDEFEVCESAESKFAHAMDNLQPLLLNDSNGGADWREHSVSAKQVYGRQEKTRMGSELLYSQVTDRIIRKNIELGNIQGKTETAEHAAEPAKTKQHAAEPAKSEEHAAEPGKTEEHAACMERKKDSRNTISHDQAAPVTARMEELYRTVSRLRAPDGCPWDRAQTHASLKAACIEEAAEVISGINILTETGNARSLCEELGDLLLQVVMHARIAEEEGLFTLDDVIRSINEKMIRRHPHVFGRERAVASEGEASGKGRSAFSPEEIPAEWKEWKTIKALEKKGREWEEPYLFDAFEEAQELIETARKRKESK